MSNQDKPIAVVLLSGGLDSATTAAIAQTRGFAVHGLTIEYGQRHVREIAASRQVAAGLNLCRHVFSSVDLRTMGGSALTGDLDVPKSSGAVDLDNGIPVTYVPARNTIFLSMALAYAEVVSSRDIFIGVNAVDYSGYPDCRPVFIEAFQNLARLATKMGVEGHAVTIHTPLIEMSKSQIIQTGTGLGVDFAWTHSCYDPTESGLACGRCDSCRLRRRGFAQAGMNDPLPYVL